MFPPRVLAPSCRPSGTVGMPGVRGDEKYKADAVSLEKKDGHTDTCLGLESSPLGKAPF